MKKIVFLSLILLTLINCNTLNIDKETYESLQDGLYAKLQTSKGDMIVKFHEKESPVTVANFIGLAQGKIENKSKKKGEPFYDGTIFHRVISDFMIQGGDPQGTGMGDPGYKFDDERNDLKHLGKGVLSMANSGPNSNGSQFFITEVPTPWLDGKHTIFGQVVKGLEVIDSIAAVDKGANDKPLTNVVLEKVEIFEKGAEYNNYDAAKVFAEGKGKIKETNQNYLKLKEEEAAKQLEQLKSNLSKTGSGLMFTITEKGSGKEISKGSKAAVHYAGRLVDGTEFDNSFKRNEPITLTVGIGQVIPGWDEGLLMLREGDKATFLIPPALGYGARGAGGVIPPNAWLIFDVEVVEVQ